MFCLILYAYGPFKWVTYRPLIFWSLNIFFIVAFSIGWIWEGKIKSKTICKWEKYDPHEKRLLKRLEMQIIINFFYELINIFRTFLFTSFNFGSLFNRLLSGINNMGDSYNSFQENVNASSVGVVGGGVITILNYLWGFFAFSTLLLSILYFKRLKLVYKSIAAATLGLVAIGYIARGTNIGVFRIVLAFIVFFYINSIKKDGKEVKNSRKKRKKSKFVLLVFLVGGGAAVISLFDKIMLSRGGILFWETSYYNIGGIGIDRNSWLLKLIPKGFQRLFVSLAGYLSQGFYGMSLTLRVPWKPMFGLGASMGIQNLFSAIVPQISQRTYQARIEQFGWDSYVQWHTMYSWIANDVSYIGVIFVMLIIGFLFAKVFQDCVNDNNPYAYLMLYYLFLMAVFLPCNNQIFQSTYTMFSFIVVFIKWEFSRRGIVIKIGEKYRLC